MWERLTLLAGKIPKTSLEHPRLKTRQFTSSWCVSSSFCLVELPTGRDRELQIIGVSLVAMVFVGRFSWTLAQSKGIFMDYVPMNNHIRERIEIMRFWEQNVRVQRQNGVTSMALHVGLEWLPMLWVPIRHIVCHKDSWIFTIVLSKLAPQKL